MTERDTGQRSTAGWIAVVIVSALSIGPLPPVASAQPQFQPQQGAVLQGLDKVTGRISTIQAPVDKPATFGSLEIVTRACRETPPEEPPESAAFLEVRDIKPDEAPVPVFSGWMFASSPALSALEHPVYDVWVVSCMKDSSSSSPSSR